MFNGLFSEFGVFSDGFEDFGVEFFNRVEGGGLEAFIPSAELFVIDFSVSLNLFHIFINVGTEDSFSVDLGIVLIFITFSFSSVVTGESLFFVGNV